MKSIHFAAALLTVTMIAGHCPLHAADEDEKSPSTNPLIEKLRGQAPSKSATPSSGFRTRGFTPRGVAPKPKAVAVPIKVTEKKVYMSRGTARGIAQPQVSTDSEAPVKLTETKAPDYNPNADSKGDLSVTAGEDAVVISYSVDPDSQLKGEIQFVKGGTEIIGKDSFAFIEQLIEALNSDDLKAFNFVIEGHASADGGANSNQTLSQSRANAIFRTLTASGVDASRIFPVGVGEGEARFAASSPETALAQDRRVLIYRLQD